MAIWMNAVVAFLALSGAFFIFSASFGLFRLKDSASRLHPTTKASAMGLMLLTAAVLVSRFAEGALAHTLVFSREGFAIVFVIFVSPLAGHVLLKAMRASRPSEE